MVKIPVFEQLTTDQTNPWQVVPRQVFTPYDSLLISLAFVVLCRVGCIRVTGMSIVKGKLMPLYKTPESGQIEIEFINMSSSFAYSLQTLELFNVLVAMEMRIYLV